jgi:ligand-binding SRPBCC domain-containing protein
MRNAFEADYVLHREATVSCPLEKVFDFFSKAENLQTLTPPWLRFRIETLPPIQMSQGATIAYRLHVRGVPLRWLTEIELWRPPYEFVDVQVKGPYKLWRHIHRFEESKEGTRITRRCELHTSFRTVGPIGSSGTGSG